LCPRADDLRTNRWDANLESPSLPANVCHPPIDRSFCPAGEYDPGVQVNPVGGYYHTLSDWFRARYPRLRLIGNAGGQLRSNQKHYSRLVDVLVSFEQTAAVARGVDDGDGDWEGLARLDTNGLPALPNLDRKLAVEAALVHTTTEAEMQEALRRALKLGYTHAYASDKTMLDMIPGGVWGVVADYLEAETAYMRTAPGN
jgi:hypothetical protein